MTKKAKPKVKIGRVEDADLLAELGLETGYQAHVGDWSSAVRSTEARAQAEADAYLAAAYPDAAEPEADADDEPEPEPEPEAA